VDLKSIENRKERLAVAEEFELVRTRRARPLCARDAVPAFQPLFICQIRQVGGGFPGLKGDDLRNMLTNRVRVMTLAVDNMFGQPGARCRDCTALLVSSRQNCPVRGRNAGRRGLVLTESQVHTLERAKAEKEAHGEFESSPPLTC
jgi:hypothetical protein